MVKKKLQNSFGSKKKLINSQNIENYSEPKRSLKNPKKNVFVLHSHSQNKCTTQIYIRGI